MNNILSLHKSKFHNGFQIDQQQGLSLVESALDLNLHVFPIENKDELILFDIDKNKIAERFSDINTVNLQNYSPETLVFKGIYSNETNTVAIPKSVKSFHFEGGDYMPNLLSNTKQATALWDKLFYLFQTALFNQSLEKRLDFEAEIRNIYQTELKALQLESPISNLLWEISMSNSTELSLGWVYLSDCDLKLFTDFKKLESLSLIYIFNDAIANLPPNLLSLKIYGSTIESLSQINFAGLNLKNLDLEGNTIKNLSEINELPNSIEELNFGNNHINYFELTALPENLKILLLDDNQIHNTFFEGSNLKTVKPNITELFLSNNNFTVNSWLLNRILETFPNLEYLELSANKTDGVPEEFLTNNENDSCLDKIKFYLKPQINSVELSYDDIKNTINRYNKTHHIILKWQHDSLPQKVILSDIQYQFKRYLGAMPKFIIFNDGIYCDIEHDEVSVVIRTDNETKKSIVLKLYASNPSNFKSYYYAYFHKIFQLIQLNTHHSILPIGSFSDQCGIYQKFYWQIYQFDIQHKKNDILRIENKESYLMVKRVEKGYLNTISKFYKNFNEVAFVIITNKNVLIYTINSDFSIGNTQSYKSSNSKIQKETPYNLSIRNSTEKTNYIKAITNPYLGKNCLNEGHLLVDNAFGQKTAIYYNPVYFFAIKDDIHCHFQQIKTDNHNLCEPKISGKNLKISIENTKIQAKYIGKEKKRNHIDS